MKTLGLVLLTPFFLLAETVISSRPARIYAHNGTVVKEIPANTKIEVKAYALDKKYFQLVKSGHLVRVIDTFNFEQYLTLNEKKKLELEAAFKSNLRELQSINTELKALKVQILETERDTALSYRNNTVSRYGGRTVYSYSRLISRTKARKLVEELHEKQQALLSDRLKFSNQSRKISAAIAGNQLELENKTAIFTNKFKNTNSYVITKNNSPIFLNSQVFKHLTLGEKVTARPHPQHSGFHQVLINKKIYTIDSKNLANMNQLKSTYTKNITNNLTAIEYQKEIIKDIQNSILLTEAVTSQLQVDDYLSGYARMKHLTVQVDPKTILVVNSQNGESVYVSSSRAKDVLEEWAIRLATLKTDIKQAEAKLLQMKKNDVDLRKEQSDILAMMD